MPKVSLKQQLINQYPKYKKLILENWGWYQNGKDEIGNDAFLDEYKIPKTQANIYSAVESDIQFEIENEVIEEEYITEGVYGGLGIKKAYFNEIQKLSCEPHGIYGN